MYKNSAKDDGDYLLDLGYNVTVNKWDSYTFKRGDVVIFGESEASTNGHIQMWDGTQFISNVKQGSGFWPYQTARPTYLIYTLP